MEDIKKGRTKENEVTLILKDFLIQLDRTGIGLILENFVRTVGKIEEKRRGDKRGEFVVCIRLDLS